MKRQSMKHILLSYVAYLCYLFYIALKFGLIKLNLKNDFSMYALNCVKVKEIYFEFDTLIAITI